MQEPALSRTLDPPDEVVRAAFRELHGRHLHGFALLLVLGDAPRAAQLAFDALAAGTHRIDELRHPERAAAWLRARVVRSARGVRGPVSRPAARRQALVELRVDPAVAAALATLTDLERAALIAASIERLDPRDVATVVGRDGAALERLLERARHRYAAAHVRTAPDAVPSGPLVDRLRTVTQRAMG